MGVIRERKFDKDPGVYCDFCNGDFHDPDDEARQERRMFCTRIKHNGSDGKSEEPRDICDECVREIQRIIEKT